ncbi:STAS domain-containing protein [Nocardia sp. NPDC127579]|uniref:STAS domain-containing protein n=1 Tax=Nocardia sp. NPDC127579 TaxID=3345402 RepID=UPI00362C7B0D
MSTVETAQVELSNQQPRTRTAQSPHPADRLRVSVTRPSRSVTLCAVAGEADQFTAEHFRHRLIGSLDSAAPTVVVDLSNVSFLGVAGLRVLQEARDWTGHTRRTLRLVTGSRSVDRLLEVASAAAPFEIAPDLASAVLGVA